MIPLCVLGTQVLVSSVSRISQRCCRARHAAVASDALPQHKGPGPTLLRVQRAPAAASVREHVCVSGACLLPYNSWGNRDESLWFRLCRNKFGQLVPADEGKLGNCAFTSPWLPLLKHVCSSDKVDNWRAEYKFQLDKAAHQRVRAHTALHHIRPHVVCLLCVRSELPMYRVGMCMWDYRHTCKR